MHKWWRKTHRRMWWEWTLKSSIIFTPMLWTTDNSYSCWMKWRTVVSMMLHALQMYSG
jgi:hypothetical protein